MSAAPIDLLRCRPAGSASPFAARGPRRRVPGPGGGLPWRVATVWALMFVVIAVSAAMLMRGFSQDAAPMSVTVPADDAPVADDDAAPALPPRGSDDRVAANPAATGDPAAGLVAQLRVVAGPGTPAVRAVLAAVDSGAPLIDRCLPIDGTGDGTADRLIILTAADRSALLLHDGRTGHRHVLSLPAADAATIAVETPADGPPRLVRRRTVVAPGCTASVSVAERYVVTAESGLPPAATLVGVTVAPAGSPGQVLARIEAYRQLAMIDAARGEWQAARELGPDAFPPAPAAAGLTWQEFRRRLGDQPPGTVPADPPVVGWTGAEG
jgi:hypothetical protein